MGRDAFDVAIAGLGVMGAATAFHLARRGAAVIGLDRFSPPHDQGSSHGHSRIIRQATFEHPSYVPLALHAYELWAELGRETGRELMRLTGGISLGAPESILIEGASASARRHRLPYETLSADEVRRRFPALRPADEMVGVYEPRAGILFAESCVDAYLEAARRAGAVLEYDEPVVDWRASASGVELRTGRATYRAASLVLALGPWLPRWMPSIKLTVERQVAYWFGPRANADTFAPERLPVYMWDTGRLPYFYGFPDLGNGVKVAVHHGGEATSAEAVRRSVGDDEVAAMRDLVAKYMPDATGELVRATTCLYTNTPDGHFLIGRHPDHPQVWVISPCSGHGFKYASAIGEVVADLATTGTTRHDISLFSGRGAC